jgi:hypothetical protein
MNKEGIDLLKQKANAIRGLSCVCHRSGIVSPEAITRGNEALDYIESHFDKIRNLSTENKVFIYQPLFLQGRGENIQLLALTLLSVLLSNEELAWFLEGELMYGNKIARKAGLKIYSEIGSNMDRMLTNLNNFPID